MPTADSVASLGCFSCSLVSCDYRFARPTLEHTANSTRHFTTNSMDTAVTVATKVATAAWNELSRRTRAYLELDGVSKIATERLDLASVKLRMASIPAAGIAKLGPLITLAERAAVDARQLGDRIALQVESIKNARFAWGSLSTRIGRWWNAAGERDELLGYVDRAEKLVDDFLALVGVAAKLVAASAVAEAVLPSGNGGEVTAARAMWGNDPSMPWPNFVAKFIAGGVADGLNAAAAWERCAGDIKLLLIGAGGEVHVSDFAALVSSAGFPLKPAALITAANTERMHRNGVLVSASAPSLAEISLSDRLALAEKLMELNREWGGIQADIKWLTMQLKAVQQTDRAWAQSWALQLLHDDGFVPEESWALSQEYAAATASRTAARAGAPSAAQLIDRSRHAWTHLFTRYMVFWRLAGVSLDVFMHVDFPGKHRVLNYLAVLEPIEEANLRLVINKGELQHGEVVGAEWVQGRPEVFRFLRCWLRAMGCREELIPPPLAVGGGQVVVAVAAAGGGLQK